MIEFEFKGMMQFEDIEKIIFDNLQVGLSKNTQKQIESSFDFLQQFAKNKIIYGINTGFGPMARYRVNDQSLVDLQYNLIRSHSAGVGTPLPHRYVKASMLARLGTFAQAQSGVHPELPALLVEFINRGICPFIPEHGGVGASGDLVQLAHLALTLIGEGEMNYMGQWKNCSEAFAKEGLKPLKIHLREGLAITNGTSVMTGIGLVNLVYAKRLIDWAVVASSLMNEIAASYDDFMSEELNSAKKHYGQAEIARAMRNITGDSLRLSDRDKKLYSGQQNDKEVFEHRVQPYYSLRCVPQILGPALDTIKNAIETLTNELNSTCDNPVVDQQSGQVHHGGNFHGDYISFEMDKLKIAVTKLTMLAERQLNYLLHDRINGILPAFVNMGTPGLNCGLQGAQFTATSTTAECQTLSNPMCVHSIPNNNDNQDVVSMGTNSALMAKTVIENSYQVMSIHFMALVQAVDCLKIQDKLSSKTRMIYDDIRSFFPAFVVDTPKYKEIERMKTYLINKKLNILNIK